jgi:hypothetical protein
LGFNKRACKRINTSQVKFLIPLAGTYRLIIKQIRRMTHTYNGGLILWVIEKYQKTLAVNDTRFPHVSARIYFRDQKLRKQTKKKRRV